VTVNTKACQKKEEEKKENDDSSQLEITKSHAKEFIHESPKIFHTLAHHDQTV